MADFNKFLCATLILSMIVMFIFLGSGAKMNQSNTSSSKPLKEPILLIGKDTKQQQSSSNSPVLSPSSPSSSTSTSFSNSSNQQQQQQQQNNQDSEDKKSQPVPGGGAPNTPETTTNSKTKHISPSDLLFDKRRKTDRKSCCNEIFAAGLSQLSVPSDIEMLLSILSAYQREEDHQTIVELGSRLGSSTMTMLRSMAYDVRKRFATVDLEIRQPVAAMHRCEMACSAASEFPKREMFTVQGNDLLVAIPFVERQKEKEPESKFADAPYRPIDMLFIDTLHDGSLLEMELKRYPRFVRRTIVFHDSFSFYDRNEGPPNWRPPGWPRGKKKPNGLYPVIKEFLINHPEWVEEMNNVHNNGLFIIRRREVVPHIEQVTLPYPRLSGFEMEPPQEMKKIMGSFKGYATNFRGIHNGAINQCNQAYDRIYRLFGMHRERVSPPCHVAPYSNKAFASGMYSLLIRQLDDKLPLAPHLGLLLSFVTAANHYLPQAVVYVWGCEFSVFVAAAHGADQTQRKRVNFAPFVVMSPDSVSTPEMKSCPLSTNILEYFSMLGAKPEFSIPCASSKEMDVLIVSAENIAKLNRDMLQKLADSVRHRFVVYGTSLYSVKDLHEILTTKKANVKDPLDVFELKINLIQNAGVAMWERKNSIVFNYVREAKQKHASK